MTRAVKKEHLRELTPQEAVKAFMEDGDSLYFRAYNLMSLFGPEVLRALQKGELTAYVFGDPGEPMISKDDFVEWAAKGNRLKRMEKWQKEHGTSSRVH